MWNFSGSSGAKNLRTMFENKAQNEQDEARQRAEEEKKRRAAREQREKEESKRQEEVSVKIS